MDDKKILNEEQTEAVTGGDWVDLPDSSQHTEPGGLTSGKPCPYCGSTDTIGVENTFVCLACRQKFTV